MWLYFLVPVPFIALGMCVTHFLLGRKDPGVGSRFGAAVGWVALCALPVVVVSSVASMVIELALLIPVSLISFGWCWLYFTSGATCAAPIIETSGTVVTLPMLLTFQDSPWYAAAWVLQVFVLGAILVPAMGPSFTWRTKRLWVVGAFVIVNAVLALPGLWWGS